MCLSLLNPMYAAPAIPYHFLQPGLIPRSMWYPFSNRIGPKRSHGFYDLDKADTTLGGWTFLEKMDFEKQPDHVKRDRESYMHR